MAASAVAAVGAAVVVAGCDLANDDNNYQTMYGCPPTTCVPEPESDAGVDTGPTFPGPGVDAASEAASSDAGAIEPTNDAGASDAGPDGADAAPE